MLNWNGNLSLHTILRRLSEYFSLYLGPIKVVRLHIGWLVSLRLLGEGNCCAYKAEEKKIKQCVKPEERKHICVRRKPTNRPVCGSIVAVVGKEVEVELPEDVERDSSIGSGDIVVGLAEHGVETVQRHVLGQESVG